MPRRVSAAKGIGIGLDDVETRRLPGGSRNLRDAFHRGDKFRPLEFPGITH